MTVSILVPVYGVEQYIERCAISLFSQTYADIEYIFVDDCTPDHSISILREVMERFPARKPHVNILRNDRNRGLGYTRAVAVRAAHGEYLMHVDSDDRIPTDAVEKLARLAAATGADIIDGAYCEETEKGISAPVKAPEIKDEARFLRLMLCQDLVPSHVWARLIRRTLYTANNINTIEGVDYAEDFSVMPRLMYRAKRALTDDVVYYYNVANQSSYTHSMTARHMVSLARANAAVYEFFTLRHPDRRFRAAAQVGLLNMMRSVRRGSFSFELADKYCPYHVGGFPFRLIEHMLRGKCPLAIANALFLATRRAVSLIRISN